MSTESYRPNFGDLVTLVLIEESVRYYGVVTEVRGNVVTVFVGNGLLVEFPADRLERVPITPGNPATTNFMEMMRSSHRAIGLCRPILETNA